MDENQFGSGRGLGWLLLVCGLLAMAGVAVYELFAGSELSTLMKLILAGVYGGLAILLITVLRQRLSERKTDKYKDVEI